MLVNNIMTILTEGSEKKRNRDLVSQEKSTKHED